MNHFLHCFTQQKNRGQLESGQSTVLIVFVMLGMLGIVALALDGGRVFAEKRHIQNAADSAAFSGALEIAHAHLTDPNNLPTSVENDAISAAVAQALSNGYDDSLTDHSVSVQVNGPFSDNGIYYLVEVSIASELEPAFAHLVFDGPLQGTVLSVARARPSQNLAFGYAMYGAAKSGCKTVWFTGSQSTTVDGGSIHSNSSASAGNCNSAEKDGSGSVTVTGGDIEAVGSFDVSGSGSISPSPTGGAGQETLPTIPAPSCSGLPLHGKLKVNSNDSVTISPGVYTGISVGANATVTMEPGLYCVSEYGFSANGGQITGNGVTIYILKGEFDLGGNTLVDLDAPQDLVDANGNQWAGMLIFMKASNRSQVTITGSGSSSYTGTVYAPGPASPASKEKCIITGSSGSIGVNSQLICYSLKVSGTADLDISYSFNANYQFPGTLDLLK